MQEHPEWKDKQDELQTLLLEYSTLKPDVGWDEEYKATLKKKLLLLFRQQTMTQQMRTQH
ncbi:MAG: hypothetical protein H6765_08820 [Candidatus Peribacteria bacterium]|nr:MAG: hypothetical protein H6765_08820 [Candidatus Peribacteria bacterium]